MAEQFNPLSRPPKGKADRDYFWAADDPSHPQSFSVMKRAGWRVVPAKEAESLGLGDYLGVDPITGAPIKPEGAVDNAIRFGGNVLMDISLDKAAAIYDAKIEHAQSVGKIKADDADARLEAFEAAPEESD